MDNLNSLDTVLDIDQQLGEFLVERGKLRETDWYRLSRVSDEELSGQGMAHLLVKLGLVGETDVAESYAELLCVPLAQSDAYPENPVTHDDVSIGFLKEHRVVPIAERDNTMIIAMANPLDDYAADAVSLALGYPIKRWVGTPTEIETAIENLYGVGKSRMGQILNEVELGREVEQEDVEQLKDMASEAPVIRLVNLVIQRAVELRASDIHIEPFESRLTVRYRVDGVLQEAEAPPAEFAAAIISRIKLMSKLNIAERRLPQDGRIKLRLQGNEFDVRVSSVPTMHGESVVMRLLDRESVVLDFDSLGFSERDLGVLKDSLSRPHGMILVTGPTGSGKTTTLYTALNNLNTKERKIVTVEDPVEYQIEGINQIQVKSSIGLTFANALRSIVRQDPDVIMVGEMRDLETASICVQSALTGHLVLSTLHTNNAATSVTRLLEMGVEDYLLTSTVNMVIGQRLVRVLCSGCKQPYKPPVGLVRQLGLSTTGKRHTTGLFKAAGCEQCAGTGYQGRTAIVEVLALSEPIKRLVLDHADSGRINQAALDEGMHTMRQDGIRKVLAGVTSMEEVVRVTQED